MIYHLWFPYFLVISINEQQFLTFITSGVDRSICSCKVKGLFVRNKYWPVGDLEELLLIGLTSICRNFFLSLHELNDFLKLNSPMPLTMDFRSSPTKSLFGLCHWLCILVLNFKWRCLSLCSIDLHGIDLSIVWLSREYSDSDLFEVVLMTNIDHLLVKMDV